MLNGRYEKLDPFVCQAAYLDSRVMRFGRDSAALPRSLASSRHVRYLSPEGVVHWLLLSHEGLKWQFS